MLSGARRQYLVVVALSIIWCILYFYDSIHRANELVRTGLLTTGGWSAVSVHNTYVVESRKTHAKALTWDRSTESNSELRDAITTLFKTTKIHPTQHYYRDSKGKYFSGASGNESTWQTPLGKRILIVDIDTRVPTGDNQILDPSKKIDWESLESGGTGLVSHAITNHYLYALIHGYEYRYYQALNMPDHYPTWIRPHIFKELLPDYEFIVAMDADVVVSHLEIPLEWMFNRWGIAKHTSMALPHDTEEFVDGSSSNIA